MQHTISEMQAEIEKLKEINRQAHILIGMLNLQQVINLNTLIMT